MLPLPRHSINNPGICDETCIREMKNLFAQSYDFVEVVDSVQCCCDIQFSKHEFLYAVKHPEHPFSRKVVELSERIKGLC
jgi:hypothetical protein